MDFVVVLVVAFGLCHYIVFCDVLSVLHGLDRDRGSLPG
jgi:hypothetical protein